MKSASVFGQHFPARQISQAIFVIPLFYTALYFLLITLMLSGVLGMGIASDLALFANPLIYIVGFLTSVGGTAADMGWIMAGAFCSYLFCFLATFTIRRLLIASPVFLVIPAALFAAWIWFFFRSAGWLT
jgi:hypothetical protein